MPQNVHQGFSLFGVIGGVFSTLFAAAADGPMWVPIACAIITAAIPLANALLAAYRAWQASIADRSMADAKRIAELTSHVEKLQKQLRDGSGGDSTPGA